LLHIFVKEKLISNRKNISKGFEIFLRHPAYRNLSFINLSADPPLRLLISRNELTFVCSRLYSPSHYLERTKLPDVTWRNHSKTFRLFSLKLARILISFLPYDWSFATESSKEARRLWERDYLGGGKVHRYWDIKLQRVILRHFYCVISSCN